MTYIYLIASDRHLKIGISSNPDSRLRQLQTSSPDKLSLLYTLEALTETDARSVESLLHRHYAEFRRSGEWFEVDPQLIINDIEWALHLSQLVSARDIKKTETVTLETKVTQAKAQPFRMPNFMRRSIATIQGAPVRTPKKMGAKLVKALEWLKDNPDSDLSNREVAKLLMCDEKVIRQARKDLSL